jgi:hypothetical protein
MTRLMILTFAVLGIAGCAIQSADENRIVIDHTAQQPGFAKWTAEAHCAEYGKRAVFLVKGPRETNGLVPETDVSIYDCVK